MENKVNRWYTDFTDFRRALQSNLEIFAAQKSVEAFIPEGLMRNGSSPPLR
jgi:hypothetical protein